MYALKNCLTISRPSDYLSLQQNLAITSLCLDFSHPLDTIEEHDLQGLKNILTQHMLELNSLSLILPSGIQIPGVNDHSISIILAHIFRTQKSLKVFKFTWNSFQNENCLAQGLSYKTNRLLSYILKQMTHLNELNIDSNMFDLESHRVLGEAISSMKNLKVLSLNIKQEIIDNLLYNDLIKSLEGIQAEDITIGLCGTAEQVKGLVDILQERNKSDLKTKWALKWLNQGVNMSSKDEEQNQVPLYFSEAEDMSFGNDEQDSEGNLTIKSSVNEESKDSDDQSDWDIYKYAIKTDPIKTKDSHKAKVNAAKKTPVKQFALEKGLSISVSPSDYVGFPKKLLEVNSPSSGSSADSPLYPVQNQAKVKLIDSKYSPFDISGEKKPSCNMLGSWNDSPLLLKKIFVSNEPSTETKEDQLNSPLPCSDSVCLGMPKNAVTNLKKLFFEENAGEAYKKPSQEEDIYYPKDYLYSKINKMKSLEKPPGLSKPCSNPLQVPWEPFYTNTLEKSSNQVLNLAASQKDGMGNQFVPSFEQYDFINDGYHTPPSKQNSSGMLKSLNSTIGSLSGKPNLFNSMNYEFLKKKAPLEISNIPKSLDPNPSSFQVKFPLKTTLSSDFYKEAKFVNPCCVLKED